MALLRIVIFVIVSVVIASVSYAESSQSSPAPSLAYAYNCNTGDTLSGVWLKLLKEIPGLSKQISYDRYLAESLRLNKVKKAEEMHSCGNALGPWYLPVDPPGAFTVPAGTQAVFVKDEDRPMLTRLVVLPKRNSIVEDALSEFKFAVLQDLSLGEGAVNVITAESTPDDVRHQAKAQIAKLKRENSELKTKLAQAEDELEIADVAVGNLGDALTALENEIKVRSLENEQLVAKLEGEKNSSTLAEKLLSSIESQYKAMEARMERMEKKLTSLVASEPSVPAKVSQLVDPSVSETAKPSLAGEIIASALRNVVPASWASHKTGDGSAIFSAKRDPVDKSFALVILVVFGILLFAVGRGDKKVTRRRPKND